MAFAAPKMRDLAAGLVQAEQYGEGKPPLVLFHSLLADRSSFGRVVAPLAEHFTVFLPDLPGFFGSAPVAGGLDAVADRMADALRDLDLPAAPILLGNGYGGFIALLVALRHPGLLAGLVIADAGATFSEPGRAAFRGMANAAEAAGLEKVAETAMRRLFAPDYHAANPDVVADRRARFLAMDRDVFITACRALAELDVLAALPGLALPVLVVVGAQDEATPPPMAEALAAGIAGAQHRVLPGCAHVPQLQEPVQFLDAVLPFLLDIYD